jgi:hypothetical protein
VVWSSREKIWGWKRREDAESERGAADFFFFYCPFWVRCGLGGCRNEFVGERNVPETANRTGCVHGPVGRKLGGPDLSPELEMFFFVWENNFLAQLQKNTHHKIQITTRIVDLPRITAGEGNARVPDPFEPRAEIGCSLRFSGPAAFAFRSR